MASFIFDQGRLRSKKVFSVEGRCYNMKFITREKYVKNFFPDFKMIMDNFQVFEPKPVTGHKKGPALREDGILP